MQSKLSKSHSNRHKQIMILNSKPQVRHTIRTLGRILLDIIAYNARRVISGGFMRIERCRDLPYLTQFNKVVKLFSLIADEHHTSRVKTARVSREKMTWTNNSEVQSTRNNLPLQSQLPGPNLTNPRLPLCFQCGKLDLPHPLQRLSNHSRLRITCLHDSLLHCSKADGY